MSYTSMGCKSNEANPRWGCKSNFDGAVSPMGRCVHTNWGAQYRGAVSPASLLFTTFKRSSNVYSSTLALNNEHSLYNH